MFILFVVLSYANNMLLFDIDILTYANILLSYTNIKLDNTHFLLVLYPFIIGYFTLDFINRYLYLGIAFEFITNQILLGLMEDLHTKVTSPYPKKKKNK